MIDFAATLAAGIPDDDYHAQPGLSSTGARKILECPARFKWERDHPPEAKATFDFGKVAHKLILGEGAPIQIVEADNWVTKAAKAERDAARADGAVPVLRAEYDAAVAMREAVMAHPTAAALFTNGQAELSGAWKDETTGVALRFRPDWLTTTLSGRVVCVDYKTTVNANPADFAASVAKFGYHMQHAFYVAGLAAHGIEDAGFLFVAQEKTAPYAVSVIELDTNAVLYGARRNRKAIDLYAHCIEHDTWPAYGDGITTVDLPRWAYYKEGNE